jgi:hypothetical protein
MKLETLRWALSTLYDEIVRFRFDYPLMVVNEAGSRESLHYYLYKYKKAHPRRAVLRLDSRGIAQAWARTTGVVYRPAFIAKYALGNLHEYLQHREPTQLQIFLKQVEWLEQHAIIRDDGAAVWPHHFNLQEGPIHLKAPWISSNVQGLVMSALIRGWRVTGRSSLLELSERASRVFHLDWSQNGIRVQAEGHIAYTEVPGLPAPGIMDGFMTSLLGLYDLYVETGEPTIHRLFYDGVKGLGYFLPRWDYRKKWSMYSNREYLCPPSYHLLNCALLSVLANLTQDTRLKDYVLFWNPASLSLLDRAEIYSAFVVTKNRCRLKYRTWRQKLTTSRDPMVSFPSSYPANLFHGPHTADASKAPPPELS